MRNHVIDISDEGESVTVGFLDSGSRWMIEITELSVFRGLHGHPSALSQCFSK